jgi:hypothetical protein
MPGWFDIYSWPIAIGDRDDKAGIIAAVREVEKHVEMLRKSGIPHERIIIGGFSDNYFYDDTWYFNLTNNRWLQRRKYALI